MNAEALFDQVIAALEVQQEKVSEDILDIRVHLAQGDYNEILLKKAKELVDLVERDMTYRRALDILAAMRGAFVECVGMTREQEDLLRKIGFKF